MSLSCVALTDEVQSLVGRTGDAVLIDNTRVTRWLNEAQEQIVKECPFIQSLRYQSNNSIDFSTDKVRYLATDITFDITFDVTTKMPAHIENVWRVDGADSYQLAFQPTDEFDSNLIDPTHSDFGSSTPKRWTLRGSYIEIVPRPSSDYDADTMRIDCVRYARDFTTESSSVSDITRVDKGLIYYAVAEAWAALGNEDKCSIWKKKFSNPRPILMEDYGWFEYFKDSCDQLNDSWGYDLLFGE